jgi:hypothetical protein
MAVGGQTSLPWRLSRSGIDAIGLAGAEFARPTLRFLFIASSLWPNSAEHPYLRFDGQAGNEQPPECGSVALLERVRELSSASEGGRAERSANLVPLVVERQVLRAGQVVRRVLLRGDIVVDAETAQLVAVAVQAALQPVVRLPGRRAGARVVPSPVVSRCSDTGSCPGREGKAP